MIDLIILIFGCLSKSKYFEELKVIEETWSKETHTFNIKFKVFVGNEPYNNNFNFSNLEIIPLNTKDDYYSATIKQYQGLRHLLKLDFKYVFVMGSDTFVNIPKLLRLLESLNYQDKIYLGGHGDNRQINQENIYFHSGGAGFILSKNLVIDLFKNFPDIEKQWKIFLNNNNYFIHACDVSIAYFISKLKEIKIIKNNNFYHCNYLGRPCCRSKINKKEIITCHLMKSNDIKTYYQELKDNNFYLN